MTGQFRYGDLGDERFQQLVQAALVTEGGGDVRCFPLNQTDGGRDIADGRGRVYQVKFSDKPVSNPATWISKTLESESRHFRWLIDEKGMTEYYMVTNIEGSAAPHSGHRDKVEEVLDGFQKKYGINFFCWWQSDMDARVVNLRWETKLHFGDMLLGHDYAAYMAKATHHTEKSREIRSLLSDIAAAQYERESEVRFKQDEVVHGKSLNDLFIDVEIASEDSAASRRLGGLSGGACQALLATSHPAVVLQGAPGQGKSTLLQYACQCYRAAFLDDEDNFPRPPSGDSMSNLLRFPIRIDLKDYADWMSHRSTRARNERGGTTRFRARTGFRHFLANHLSNYTAQQLTAGLLDELLDRLPVFLGLDGLDEIADQTVRAKAVEEVDQLVAQVIARRPESLIVVTTRPSFGLLPEPKASQFTRARLVPLSVELKEAYIEKWAKVYNLPKEDIDGLWKVYRERSLEPYFTALTENPMQLTVILPLINRYGASTPTQRTELYTKYMDLLFAREADKDSRILAYQDELEEVAPYLAWRLHSEAEDASQAKQYTRQEMVRVIGHFLLDLGHPTDMADDLFTGAWQRIWVLTCKDQVHFEFEVQSVREYFTAKFLSDIPQHDEVSPSRVLLELARREYWSNTTRFLAGFLPKPQIPDLADAFIESFDTLTDTGYRSAWNLLYDGTFKPRPLAQRRLIEKLLGDRHATSVVADYIDTAAVRLAPEHGGDQLVELVRARITHHEDSHILRRLEAWHASDADFFQWWEPLMRSALGTTKAAFWLRQGRERAAGALVEPSVWNQLNADDAAAVREAADSGANPDAGSEASRAILREVLDGQWSPALLSSSMPHDIISLAHPMNFINLATPDRHRASSDTQWRKQTADRAQHPIILRLYEAMKGTGRGQKGTTAVWQSSAHALNETFGPTWLAGCIAVIGSLSPFTTGGTINRGKPPLGPHADYAQLIPALRQNADNAQWWTESARTYTDSLSQRVWCLALVTKARPQVLLANLTLLDAILTRLEDHSYQRLLEAVTLVGESGLCTNDELPEGTSVSQRTLDLMDALSALSAAQVAEAAAPEPPSESVRRVAERDHWLDYLVG